MHSLYNFVSGPLAWAAFIIFIGGSLFRLIHLIVLVHKKERFIYSYMSLKYSLRSILHWITPFATTTWKKHPVLTVVTFSFHICLFITPIFLLAHVILWDESFKMSWWSLPDSVAIFMALIVIGDCVFFLFRRLISPEVNYVTSISDYVILAIVAAPFITGFLAYYQWFGYEILMILHVIAGEILLIAIPFTRLSHMLFSPLIRAYMGSEFGGVRHARDW
ncbi:MAG: TmcC family electron transfer complex membrane anchor subunit [Dissulfuribacterales bacterium]